MAILPGAAKSPICQSRELPDEVGGKYQEQNHKVGTADGAMQRTVERGKPGSAVFAKYQLADPIDRERQEQQAEQHQEQESGEFPQG